MPGRERPATRNRSRLVTTPRAPSPTSRSPRRISMRTRPFPSVAPITAKAARPDRAGMASALQVSTRCWWTLTRRLRNRSCTDWRGTSRPTRTSFPATSARRSLHRSRVACARAATTRRDRLVRSAPTRGRSAARLPLPGTGARRDARPARWRHARGPAREHRRPRGRQRRTRGDQPGADAAVATRCGDGSSSRWARFQRRNANQFPS